jgi:hypothetical protein
MKNKKEKDSNSKRKNVKKNSQNSSFDDEDSKYEKIKDITLKRARNPYTIFLMEQYKKEKDKNPEYKKNVIEYRKDCDVKWKKLSENAKEKYEALSEKEREKYKNDVEQIRILFFNQNKEGATAYRIFLNEKLKEAIDTDANPQDVKKEASKEWAQMSNEDKAEWKKKKKENDTWWDRCKKTRNVNAYSVFIQKKFEELKKDDDDATLTFKEVSKYWNKLSDKEKLKYKRFADDINEERRKAKDIYEITHGIQPARPAGAYRLFLSQVAKEGKLKGKKNPLVEGKRLWENLDNEEKDYYLKLSHRVHLCYIYKKMKFKEFQRKLTPIRPLTARSLFFKKLKGTDLPEGSKNFMEYANEKWKQLSEKEKKKYFEQAEEEKKKFEKKKNRNPDKIFNYPQKALSAFNFYIKEKVSEFKEENPDVPVNQVLKEMSQKWNELKQKQKEKYNKKAEKDKKRFLEQQEEFKKNGYYTQAKTPTNTASKKTQKSQSQKKRSQKKSASPKKSNKK